METQIQIPKGIDLNKNISYEKFRINPLEEISEPPIVITIDGSPTMMAGSFSLTIGKAKSAKTFFSGAIVAGFLSENTQLNRIKSTPQENQNVALYFDTEQSLYHAQKSIKRISKLTGNNDLINLRAYSLRPLSPNERLHVIEDLIYSSDNLGLVVIDGIRDLLTNGINDEAEATKVSSKILKWTADLGVHVIAVLHQNKNDFNARGHIGTELVNKADTVISVTKKNPECFVVSCMESRDVPFNDFAFKIEGDIPVSTDFQQDQSEISKKQKPEDIEDDVHLEVLFAIFQNKENFNYPRLQDAIIDGFDNKFGKNASREYITHYLAKEWLKKEKKGQNTNYYLC